MVIRRALVTAAAMALVWGAVGVSSDADAATASAAVAAGASGVGDVARSEIVATLQDRPYFYQSSQFFSARTSTPKITRTTTELRVELAPDFLAAEPRTIDWSIGSALHGTTPVEPTTTIVDIPIPADFYDRALTIYGEQKAISLGLHATGVVPEAGRIPTDFEATNVSQAYNADARYTVRLTNTPDLPTTTEVRLSEFRADSPYNDERYWASVPEGTVVEPDSVVRFQASSALWGRDGVAPSASLSEPEAIVGHFENPIPTAVSPVVSADQTSLALDFAQLPGVLAPRIAGNGLERIDVARAAAYDHGVRATTILPVGSSTSLPTTKTTRLSGATRYEGAVINAALAFQNRGPTVYIASGEDFSDALSAGAAAANRAAPLVLTSPHDVRITSYLRWLHPREIVIVGGPNSVADDQIAFLMQQAGLDASAVTVRRDSGVDRYEASRTISSTEFPDGADTAFLATGNGFADALSSIPAAASSAAPVILVKGEQPALDAPTMAELTRLGVEHVVITGGPASISTGIEEQLRRQYGDAVVRFGGATRFDVANAVNAAYFPKPSSAYLATGINFPDALTGGVLAGVEGAPLLLARTDCVPGPTRDLLASWGPPKVTLLGGPNSLGTGVQNLNAC